MQGTARIGIEPDTAGKSVFRKTEASDTQTDGSITASPDVGNDNGILTVGGSVKIATSCVWEKPPQYLHS